MVSHLKPGESVKIRDGNSALVVTRPAKAHLSASQIEEELEKIFEAAPRMDCQSVLDDLRE